MTSRSEVANGPLYPLELQCQARLSDGQVASIRPISPGDATALQDFHDHLSEETIYRRFFSAHPHLQAREVERYTQVDYRRRLALVVEIDGRLTAVGRYDREPDSDRAEVAFVVADALQGHGVGALLLEHLAAAARRRGVATFVAQTLSINYPMQHVFRHAGFNCVERWVDGVIEVTFPVAPTQRYLEAVIQRDLLSLRARPAQSPSATGRGLGLVLGREVDTEAVLRACQFAGLDISTMIVTEGPGFDATDALLYVGADPETEVLALVSARPLRPRRFVVVAREAVRGRPVVSMLAPGQTAVWAEQAGVVGTGRIEDLVDRAGELLQAKRGHNWLPPPRGQLVELPDCDVARARAVLDQVSPAGLLVDVAPRALTAESASEVLGAYGIPWRRLDEAELVGGSVLVLQDHPEMGLAAVSTPSMRPEHLRLTRLLPLTDRDAAELVQAVGMAGAEREAAVGVLLRAARLIDDQPDVARVEIAYGPSNGGTPALEVATGQSRITDDDPFVRRLPSTSRPGDSEKDRVSD